MPFKKGESGNNNGRPKGKPNRSTIAIKSFIVDLLHDNMETIKKDLKAVEPKDRLAFIEKLMKYAIPTQTNSIINFEKMDDDQLNTLYEELSGQITGNNE
ncbi:MAG: hypothetical protein EOO43_02375 [Flavobacterium sp.]|nr:MAG: hypothetical protein EOO43_02375 [Flavobacterium sp.]